MLLLLCAGLRMGGGVAVPVPPTPPVPPSPSGGGGGTTFLSNTSIRRKNYIYDEEEVINELRKEEAERLHRESVDVAVALFFMDGD